MIIKLFVPNQLLIFGVPLPFPRHGCIVNNKILKKLETLDQWSNFTASKIE